MIPHREAIKDVPIYNRIIKEKFFNKPGRKKKDIPTTNVVGQLSSLMFGRAIFPKNLYPGSPFVDVKIDDVIVCNSLIDIGVDINLMTKENMLKLNLSKTLRKITIVLQLAYWPTISSEGIGEDVMVSIDSWNYPIDFWVLQ